MTSEEQKIMASVIYCPAYPELKVIKLRSHNLSQKYSNLREDQAEERQAILDNLLAEFGAGSFIQGPVFFHYGSHTRIGKGCFINYNFTVQDDAPVTIGDDCNLGPNVTIVTPVHPMLPRERKSLRAPAGEEKHLCYAKPVKIGHDYWFGANDGKK